MTTIVKTINPATKAIVQTRVDSTTASLNIAPNTIVEIQAGRAQIASFIQNGKNLVLVMVDGTEIVLQGYFDNAEGAVKKLILTDENGSVEVQFPAADGSVADGAPVDVAPSYVAADAATTASLTDGAAQGASASGVSPVLLGLLGAGGVAAALAGGGGGGDSAAPAEQPEQPLVPTTEPETKTESKTEIEPEPKVEPKPEPEPKVEPEVEVLSPAALVAKIKELSATVLASKDDSKSDSAEAASAQQKLLDLKSVVAEKIADIDQSASADDQQIKAELQVLSDMLGKFSTAAELEAKAFQVLEQKSKLFETKENAISEKTLEVDALNEEIEKNELDLTQAKTELKALNSVVSPANKHIKDALDKFFDADERLASALEKGDEAQDAVKVAKESLEITQKDATNALNAASENNPEAANFIGPFVRMKQASQDLDVLKPALSKLIGEQDEIIRKISAAEDDIQESIAKYEEATAAKLDTLSPAVLLSEIDELNQSLVLLSEIVELNHSLDDLKNKENELPSLLKNIADDAMKTATELQDAKAATKLASDAYHATTGSWGLGMGDSAKFEILELAQERLKTAEQRDIQAKEDLAQAEKFAADLHSAIESISEQIAQKEAPLAEEAMAKSLIELGELKVTLNALNGQLEGKQSDLDGAKNHANEAAEELSAKTEAVDKADAEFDNLSWLAKKLPSAEWETLESAKKEQATAEKESNEAEQKLQVAEHEMQSLRDAIQTKAEAIERIETELNLKPVTPDVGNNDLAAESGTDDSTEVSIEASEKAPSVLFEDSTAKTVFSGDVEKVEAEKEDQADNISAPVEAPVDAIDVLSNPFEDQPQALMQ